MLILLFNVKKRISFQAATRFSNNLYKKFDNTKMFTLEAKLAILK